MAIPQERLVRLALLGALLEPGACGDILAETKRRLREFQAREPISAAASTVLLGALLFYVAERGKNPHVTSYLDALEYVSTKFSAGYSGILAQTPLGKLLDTTVATFGPAMAAGVFAHPAADRLEEEQAEARAKAESLELDRAILDRLDRILAALQAREEH